MEYVQPENEEGEVSEVIEKVPQNLQVKVPEGPVANLAMLARLHGLEESNLMYWILEFGEEGLMRAIEEMHDRLNFETESVASEVPWKGDVLQVYLQVLVSQQKRKKFAFYFEDQVDCQKVHGGSSLAEWCLGLQGQGLGRGVDGCFATLGGRVLNHEREVSGLGLSALQEVVFNGRLGVRQFVAVARWWRSLTLVSGNAHSVVLLTVGTLVFRAIGVGLSGIGSMAVQGHGGLVGGQGRGNGIQAIVVGQRSGAWERGFSGREVGSAWEVRWFGPTGRDQAYVPQGEPTFRKGGGAHGSGEECRCSWGWCW